MLRPPEQKKIKMNNKKEKCIFLKIIVLLYFDFFGLVVA